MLKYDLNRNSKHAMMLKTFLINSIFLIPWINMNIIKWINPGNHMKQRNNTEHYRVCSSRLGWGSNFTILYLLSRFYSMEIWYIYKSTANHVIYRSKCILVSFKVSRGGLCWKYYIVKTLVEVCTLWFMAENTNLKSSVPAEGSSWKCTVRGCCGWLGWMSSWGGAGPGCNVGGAATVWLGTNVGMGAGPRGAGEENGCWCWDDDIPAKGSDWAGAGDCWK